MSGDASFPDMDKGTVKVDLSESKRVALPSREDLLELLRSGEVVVIDRSTGKFLTQLLGVPLPPAERVLETVLSKGTSQFDPNKIM